MKATKCMKNFGRKPRRGENMQIWKRDIKWSSKKQGGKMRVGFVWPWIRTGGGLSVNTEMNLQVP